MAETANTPSMPAQQPGLRPFIVYDRLPAGLAAYPVLDNSVEPLLRAGEVVVVDPTDTEPAPGELFLIRWMNDPVARIAETWRMPRHDEFWCVGAVRNPAWIGDKFGRWCDWPYTSGNLGKKLLGRVIGILEPVMAEPKRLEVA